MASRARAGDPAGRFRHPELVEPTRAEAEADRRDEFGPTTEFVDKQRGVEIDQIGLGLRPRFLRSIAPIRRPLIREPFGGSTVGTSTRAKPSVGPVVRSCTGKVMFCMRCSMTTKDEEQVTEALFGTRCHPSQGSHAGFSETCRFRRSQ